MSAVKDHVLTQVIRLQINVLACRERLAADTDPEALHDLRIALRQLRSLLRPLARLNCCEQVLQHAAAFGRLSSPLRDLQVLRSELLAQDQHQAAQARGELLPAGYAELLQSPSLQDLLQALQQWPEGWRQAKANGELRGLDRRIRRRLDKNTQRLRQALQAPQPDRHRVRLLVKRLRYASALYPRQTRLSAPALSLLKQAQSALGDWHDHWQWLLRAEREVDLQPCRQAWQQAMYLEQARADRVLDTLIEKFSS
jgi:CHAD domain-containing protein